MNKKFIILIIFILLLIAGGVFWWCQGNQKQIVKGDVEAQIQIKNEKRPVEIILSDGAKLTIPPGSASVGSTIIARRLDPVVAPSLPEWSHQAILLYEFGVSSPLQKPVIVQIPLPKGDELFSLGHYHDEYWEIIPFIVEGNIALVETENLSLFGWLDTNVEWFADKAVDFLTLHWAENMTNEPFCQNQYKNIGIDESNSLGFISGCAKNITNGKIQLSIRNDAPIPLEVFPVGDDLGKKDIQLVKRGVYLYKVPSVDGTVLAPRDTAEWSVDLSPGENITFEAYFSDSASATFVGDIFPLGEFSRGLLESCLFFRNGKKMTWAGIKDFLAFPFFAEFSKTLEELDGKFFLDHGHIQFVLSTESQEITKLQEPEEKNKEKSASDEDKKSETGALVPPSTVIEEEKPKEEKKELPKEEQGEQTEEAQTEESIKIKSILIESPHPYANNYTKTWIISEPGVSQIRLHFKKIELPYSNSSYYAHRDHLIIYDKNDKNLTSWDYISEENWNSRTEEQKWTEWFATDTLKIKLDTNNDSTAYGFIADKIETRLNVVPSTSYLAESYHPYANNYTNTWIISEPGVSQIRLHFKKIELPYSNSSYYAHRDHLIIYDKNDKNLTSWDYISEENWNSRTEEQKWTEWFATDTLKIKLDTNNDSTAYGFIADKIETRN